MNENILGNSTGDVQCAMYNIGNVEAWVYSGYTLLLASYILLLVPNSILGTIWHTFMYSTLYHQ